VLERALVDLAKKSMDAPKRLAPADLAPLRAAAGDGAITYVLVAGSFHFINRVADLLHVDSEALPERLRKVELLRRVSVRIAAQMFRRVDLANRAYGRTFEQVLEESGTAIAKSAAAPLADRLAPLRARPHAVDILRLALEERDQRSSLHRALLRRVHRGVEDALPSGPEESVGFHARPLDPVDAFVFVGTRYAARTTIQMVDALRAAGFEDLGVLDLAIAIADANQWARTHRLLGLDAGLFYLDDPRPDRGEAIDT